MAFCCFPRGSDSNPGEKDPLLYTTSAIVSKQYHQRAPRYGTDGPLPPPPPLPLPVSPPLPYPEPLPPPPLATQWLPHPDLISLQPTMSAVDDYAVTIEGKNVLLGARVMSEFFGFTARAKTSIAFAVGVFSKKRDLPKWLREFVIEHRDQLIAASRKLIRDGQHDPELRLASLVKKCVKITDDEGREYCGELLRIWWDKPSPESYEVTLLGISGEQVVRVSAAVLRAGSYRKDGKLLHPLEEICEEA